ncbi:MAG: hypothetical protein K2X03_12600 [Bryobacteraceae bacterium]|nr:hypothetical protein [Bryobacteraceae bacterium]
MMDESELLEAAKLPLLALGARANAVREAAHGNRVYFSAQALPGEALALPSSATAEDAVAALLSLREGPSVEPRVLAMNGDTTGEAEIRLIALARLALPPTTHIRANWSVLTDAMAQVALRFGADELTGFPPDLDRREIWRAIREAGREPYPCDAQYREVEMAEPVAKLRVLP